MQIYSRHSRRRVRYALRCLRGLMTSEEWAALVLALSVLLALVMMPGTAGAEPPPGGTIPPISGIRWPDQFVYLPYVARPPRGL